MAVDPGHWAQPFAPPPMLRRQPVSDCTQVSFLGELPAATQSLRCVLKPVGGDTNEREDDAAIPLRTTLEFL